MLVQSVRGARSSALHGARSSEYVHAHHAACTTDVIKHVVLGVLLRHMLAKPKPFVYVGPIMCPKLVDAQDERGAFDLVGEEEFPRLKMGLAFRGDLRDPAC